MKSLLAVICLLTGASLLTAQTAPADKTTPPSATTAPATPVKPGVSTPATKAKVDPKKEAEPKIPGMTIQRANGTFLGLEVVDTKFKLSFYDAKKKPMAPDVARASARWPNPRSVVGPNRTVLNPSGNALIGAKPVLPPLNFTVHLTLLEGDGEDAKAMENYDVAVRN